MQKILTLLVYHQAYRKRYQLLMSVEYMYGLSDVDRSKRAMLRTDFENPAISTGREVAFRMTTENGSVQLIGRLSSDMLQTMVRS